MKIKYTEEEYELMGGDKACLKAMRAFACTPLVGLSGTKKFEMWFKNEILRVRKAQKRGKSNG